MSLAAWLPPHSALGQTKKNVILQAALIETVLQNGVSQTLTPCYQEWETLASETWVTLEREKPSSLTLTVGGAHFLSQSDELLFWALPQEWSIVNNNTHICLVECVRV